MAYAGENFGGVETRGSGLVGVPEFEEFSKFCKEFVKKIAKHVEFSPILQKNSNPCVKSSLVWRKTQLFGENFESF